MKKFITTLVITGTVACLSHAQTLKDAGKSRNAESKEQQVAPAPEEKQAPRPVRKTETAPQRQKSQVDEMNEVVNLDEKQEAEIRKIHEAHNANMQDIRSKYRDQKDKSGMRNEVKAAQQERRRKIQEVLTEDQRTKWKEHKKDQSEDEDMEGMEE